MARDLDVGSSQYIEASSAVVGAYPLTIMAWFNPDATTGTRTIAALGDLSAANEYARIGITSGFGFAQSKSGGAAGLALDTTHAPSNGVWSIFVGVFTNATDRKMYVDASSSPGTNATSVAFGAGIDTTAIGRTPNDGNFIDGQVAEFAVWSVALAEVEIASLVAGASPMFVRPGSLACYQDLRRNLNTPGIGPSFTNNGSTVSDHLPGMYYPAPTIGMGVPAASTVPPLAMHHYRLRRA